MSDVASSASPPLAATTLLIFFISVVGIATVFVGLSIGVWKIYRCYQNVDINIELVCM